LTGDTLLLMIENTYLCHIAMRTVFYLDGAPPHFSCHVRPFLDRDFPNRWIGRGGEAVPWPPRSPYLNFLDFFGFFKTRCL
jgi:hypothetical protein